MSGYVLIHRDLIGNPQFRGKDDEYAAIWLVVRAAWEPTTVRVGRAAVALERGQCAYSVAYLATAWGCSKASAHARLRHLESVGFIATEAGRDHTVITVLKYDTYQAGCAFGARSAGVQPERQTERQPNATPNAETHTAQGFQADGKTLPERSTTVRAERKPNAARTNKNKGNEYNNPPNPPEGGEDEPLLIPDEPKADPVAEDFKRFMAAYPKRKGGSPRQPAERAFRRALRKGTTPAALVEAAEAFHRAAEADGKVGTEFIPHAATWLNQERWRDSGPPDEAEERRPMTAAELEIFERKMREMGIAA